MNSYKATLKKAGYKDSSFDMIKSTIHEASLFAEKIGREFGADEVEVINNQLHKGLEIYTVKCILK